MKAEVQRDLEEKNWIQSESIYQGKLLHFQLDEIRIKDRVKKMEIVRHPGAAVMIPVAPKGEILLARQWRRAIRDISIELPAGTLEKDEEPIVCAQRELQEEVGFAAREMIPFGKLCTAPGFCNEVLYLFIAKNLYPSNLEGDEDEMIDVLALEVVEIRQYIKEGKIWDAKTIAALLKYFEVYA